MISRRRLFAMGGAAAVAPMLPAVAPPTNPVAIAASDAAIKATWETFSIRPKSVYIPDDWTPEDIGRYLGWFNDRLQGRLTDPDTLA